MDKTRTLPPQVRGKVTGDLDFYVDEVKLFRNIFLISDNYDLVLQVQWWGEVLPVFIRPKEVQIPGKTKRSSHLLECSYHSTKYEIKTTLDLFKSYLKNCEVLELSLLEAVENYVIGSAFLKDLINLLNSNNELIKTPIFDYLGEEIGEAMIHVNFFERPKQKNKESTSQNTQFFKNYYDSENLEKQIISNKIKSDCFTLKEKTILYDVHSKGNNEMEASVKPESSMNHHNTRKNERIISSSSVPVCETKNTDFNKTESLPSCKLAWVGEESACKCLPEIETTSDSSKVLNFGVSSSLFKCKTNKKKQIPKITKFNSNSIKCKSKFPEKLPSFDQSSIYCKKLDRKTESHLNEAKNVNKIKKEKQLSLKASEEFVKVHPGYELGDIQSIPSAQSSDKKVLDYLLGSNMSKHDEETALDDFKKMSPSYNLVDSISQLCLVSKKDSEKYSSKPSARSIVSTKPTCLNFDFTNPIERSYYEKFFLNSNSPEDFEIAELLNQPENSLMVGGQMKSNKIADEESELQLDNLNNTRESSFFDEDVKEEAGEDHTIIGNKSSCARCKYYKKLNELDTIIESLKHFEQKMLEHEKALQMTYK